MLYGELYTVNLYDYACVLDSSSNDDLHLMTTNSKLSLRKAIKLIELSFLKFRSIYFYISFVHDWGTQGIENGRPKNT